MPEYSNSITSGRSMLAWVITGSALLLANGAIAAEKNVVPEQDERLFTDAGVWLSENGIRPHLIASQNWLGSIGAGITPDKRQAITMLMAGADFDLDKMGLISGSNIHFMQLWVPWVHGLNYGGEVGSLLAGNPPPYIPKVAHLLRFTWEQKMFDDRLEIEAGKSNPGSFFGTTQCNVAMSCVNTVLTETAGFAAPPYAGWGLRVGYHFTPEITSNIGVWRTYEAYPFTNGWEGKDDDLDTGITIMVANVTKKSNWQQEAYPFNWEVLGFHNFKDYNDAYYTQNGTSKVYDTSSPVRQHTGVSGFYLSGSKAFWRRDGGGDPSNPTPSALSVHGSVTQAFSSYGNQGISTIADAGVTWSAPWQSRPFDSYGVFFRWAKLSDREQRYLQDQYNAMGGTGWNVPGNEYQLGLDASFMLTPEINVQMTGARTWSLNTYQNPYTSVSPRSGYTFWLQANVLVDKLLGL